jgi:peptidoglycan hydrolase-like protein with peptidoglycan-binding domain
LARYEIMEVQTRLQWLGFDPGGLDGVSGRLTAAAIKRFEASIGQPQTGHVDQSLLTRLRQDSLTPAKP